MSIREETEWVSERLQEIDWAAERLQLVRTNGVGVRVEPLTQACPLVRIVATSYSGREHVTYEIVHEFETAEERRQSIEDIWSDSDNWKAVEVSLVDAYVSACSKAHR